MPQPRIRKIYEFYDVVPFQLEGDSLSYGDLGYNDMSKTVSFAFTKYITIDKNNIPINNGV
jgi:hypothetical protein